MTLKVKSMKLIIAYIRPDCCANVMRELHEAGVGGITAYRVHGMSPETSTFSYSKRAFEINHFPESITLEVICAEEPSDRNFQSLAQAARTGDEDMCHHQGWEQC